MLFFLISWQTQWSNTLAGGHFHTSQCEQTNDLFSLNNYNVFIAVCEFMTISNLRNYNARKLISLQSINQWVRAIKLLSLSIPCITICHIDNVALIWVFSSSIFCKMYILQFFASVFVYLTVMKKAFSSLFITHL